MNDRFKNAQFIDPKTIFESFRLVNLLQAKTPKKESPDELFFSVKTKDTSPNYKSIHGYVKMTPIIQEVIRRYLFKDRSNNIHLTLTEWNDRYLVTVEDGIYISSYSFFATKESVKELFNLEDGADTDEQRQEVATTKE